MPHQFNLHQLVRLTSTSSLARVSPTGLYEVIRLMPEDPTGVFSYRLKSPAGERVARESEIIESTGAVPS